MNPLNLPWPLEPVDLFNLPYNVLGNFRTHRDKYMCRFNVSIRSWWILLYSETLANCKNPSLPVYPVRLNRIQWIYWIYIFWEVSLNLTIYPCIWIQYNQAGTNGSIDSIIFWEVLWNFTIYSCIWIQWDTVIHNRPIEFTISWDVWNNITESTFQRIQ